MIDFVKELSVCRVEGTQLPFYPEKVQGYTEQEVELIAKNLNLDIHGQFREFLFQMGRCSGGLLWGSNFPMYSSSWSIKDFELFQINEKADEDYMSCPGAKDPIEEKIFYLHSENDLTLFYYLFTNQKDDYIWGYYEDEDRKFEKTKSTLLDQLKYYVS
ncbi:SMI1/KNR4 family protein, partial [Acinetobacter seifertii]|uniref:SMI1/KNR4 family protein n=2 Tax=Acinetobacter seifertii TaxID=1530123 RepID=UPI000C1E8919